MSGLIWLCLSMHPVHALFCFKICKNIFDTGELPKLGKAGVVSHSRFVLHWDLLQSWMYVCQSLTDIVSSARFEKCVQLKKKNALKDEFILQILLHNLVQDASNIFYNVIWRADYRSAFFISKSWDCSRLIKWEEIFPLSHVQWLWLAVQSYQ